MNNIRYVLFITIGIGFILLLSSQQPVEAGLFLPESRQQVIDAYIEEQMHNLQIPGLAIAIVRGDQIEYVRGYGVADSAGRPVTPQTPFLIASLSKSMTALAVMQLAEEGHLQLDAPVQQYLPWFKVADSEVSSQLTLRHLLHHTSGFSELEGYQRNLDKDSSDSALEASVRSLAKSRLIAPPGDKFEYSNTNYDILGLIIQTVSGIPYETIIEERIFAPLNMQNSFTSLEKARIGGVSSGHTSFAGKTVGFDRFMPYSRAVVPSAGLFSSAEDMAHYLFAHLNHGRSVNGKPILSPAGVSELHAPGINIGEEVSYAMGWTVFPFPQAAGASSSGGLVPHGISHGGDWANFKSLMVMVPEHDLGVVVLMNKNDSTQSSAYNTIGWNTALLALGLEPVSFPSNEGFLKEYGLYILATILLLLLISFVWSVQRLLQRTPDNKTGSPGRWQPLIFLIFLPLVDLALAGYLLFVQLPQSTTTLPLTLYFEPDIGIMYGLVLVFTLGWGTLRTALAIKKV